MSQLSLISLKVLVTPLNTYIDIEQRIHSLIQRECDDTWTFIIAVEAETLCWSLKYK